MIVTGTITINGKEFIKTCSDSGYLVERDGVRYGEAIDPAELGRTYTECNVMEDIPDDSDADMTEIEQKAAAYDILMGG